MKFKLYGLLLESMQLLKADFVVCVYKLSAYPEGERSSTQCTDSLSPRSVLSVLDREIEDQIMKEKFVSSRYFEISTIT